MKKSTIRLIGKIMMWLVKHIIVQQKNLNDDKDTKPKSATELKFKLDF